MNRMILAATAFAVASPIALAAPADAQNRNYNRELRECNRELRRADSSRRISQRIARVPPRIASVPSVRS